MFKFIGLNAPKFAGKTTLCQALQKKVGISVTSFAAPMRLMLEAIGVPEEFHKIRKEDPIPGWNPSGREITTRRLLTTLGTEWGRDLIDKNIWTWWLFAQNPIVVKAQKEETIVIIDDVRFGNEAQLVKDHGGVIWKIIPQFEGYKKPEDTGHESEKGIPESFVDLALINQDKDQMVFQAIRALANLSKQ